MALTLAQVQDIIYRISRDHMRLQAANWGTNLNYLRGQAYNSDLEWRLDPKQDEAIISDDDGSSEIKG